MMSSARAAALDKPATGVLRLRSPSDTKEATIRQFHFCAALLLLGAAGLSSPARAKSLPVSAGTVVWDTIFDSANIRKWVACDSGLPLPNDYYYDCFSTRWRVPHWVIHHVTRAHLALKTNRRDDFRPDKRLPAAVRVSPDDYKGKGYDKGHLAPAGDFTYDPEPMSATFLMSNMSPQYQATNRGIWQQLEGGVRDLVKLRGEAWVVTGNLFLKGDTELALPKKWLKRGGKNLVAVPTHMFKVILARDTKTKKLSEYAFLVPNSSQTTKGTPYDFMVSVDDLETLTKWDFFPLLADSLENHLESQKPAVWPW